MLKLTLALNFNDLAGMIVPELFLSDSFRRDTVLSSIHVRPSREDVSNRIHVRCSGDKEADGRI
jgi:hypothetical protein